MKKMLTLFLTFLKIGAFTFGGGYAMVTLLENEFIAKKKWIEKDEFFNMVAIAESTPGPVTINSATYLGYKIAGIPGAVLSTLAVCIPSFIVILGISLFLDRFLTYTYVVYAFKGVQACVIYLIFSAGLKLLRNLEKNALNISILTAVIAAMLIESIAAVTFSSIFYILICGILGILIYLLRRIGKDHKKP